MPFYYTKNLVEVGYIESVDQTLLNIMNIRKDSIERGTTKPFSSFYLH